MNAVTQTIRLGEREFPLRPLTLGQLRPVLDALEAAKGASGGALVEVAARIIQAGLAPSCPDLRVEDVLAFEASLDDANAAVAAILATAGLTPPGAEPAAGAPGEPEPAAMPAAGLRLPGSMEPSLPDAATTIRASTA